MGEIVNTTVEGQSVKQVSKFRYLGSLISEDGRCLDDVKTRICIRVDLRKRLVKTLVCMAGSSVWM